MKSKVVLQACSKAAQQRDEASDTSMIRRLLHCSEDEPSELQHIQETGRARASSALAAASLAAGSLHSHFVGCELPVVSGAAGFMDSVSLAA